MSPIPLGILDFPTAAAGAYDLLETQVLTSSAASVSFTGLGSYTDYKHLQVRVVAKTDRTTNQADSLNGYFNSDTGSNYAAHRLLGTGSSVASGAYPNYSNLIFGFIGGSQVDTTNHFGAQVIDILDFANTNKNTTTKSMGGVVTGQTYSTFYSSAWLNTNAVTDLQFYSVGNFIAGSRFSLYGVK